MNAATPPRRRRAVSKLLPLLVLLAGAGWGIWLIATAPQQKRATPEPLVPRVSVIPLDPVTRPVAIEAFGTVSPAREVALAPEVEGRVVAMHPALQPGGLVAEGEVLLRLDPADYVLAVAAAEALRAQAQADLDLELGRGAVAASEWERFAELLETVDEEQRSAALALRQPQLSRAQAELAAAENAVAEARLQLSRVELRAPFDAVVISRNVDIGRRLGPGTAAVQLAGVQTFWVTGSVPLGHATRLPLASGDMAPEVSVTLDTGVGGRILRTGQLMRRLPDLEAQGRMVRVLVAVDDPLSLADPELPVLPLGAFVRLDIPAGEMADVIDAPREALRENDQVWVRDAEGRLRFREVEVVWRGDAAVLLRGDFEPGDALIVSYLSDPLPGLRVDIR